MWQLLIWLLSITAPTASARNECLSLSASEESRENRPYMLPFLDYGTLLQMDASVTWALAQSNTSEVTQDRLFQRPDALGLIVMAVGVQTAMGSAVFLVVFLVIFVPVAIGVVFLVFMCMETKGSARAASLGHGEGSKSPLLDPVEEPQGRQPKPTGPASGSDNLSCRGSLSSFSRHSSRARSGHSRSHVENGPRSSRGDTTDNESLSSSSSGSGILCPELIVREVQGVTLLINGEFEPHQQEEAIEVSKTDISGEVIVRAFLSETGKDRGVLLESAWRFPIAFLDTSAAAGAVDGAAASTKPRSERKVMISRASALSSRSQYPNDSYFAVVKALNATAVVMTRGSEPCGPVLLTVHTRVGSSNLAVADAAGKLVASLEPRRNASAGQDPQHVLHVEHATDVAMVLCAVIATVKLGLP
mmetsp:Transcript_116795/g.341979  ORF Transcript_116795/g.341979 Transcript_116795/m.341979 type:complete len:418 (-) Transcript_116795:34-1287(-)